MSMIILWYDQISLGHLVNLHLYVWEKWYFSNIDTIEKLKDPSGCVLERA